MYVMVNLTANVLELGVASAIIFDYSLLLLVCCHLDQLLGHVSVIDKWTQDA